MSITINVNGNPMPSHSQPHRQPLPDKSRHMEMLRDDLVAKVLRFGKESDLTYYEALVVLEMVKDDLKAMRRNSP